MLTTTRTGGRLPAGRTPRRRGRAIWVGLPVLAAVGPALAAAPAGEPGTEAPLGETLSLWWCLPFGLLLGAIAILPLIIPHWWESNRNRAIVSFLLALPVGGFILAQDYHELIHAGQHYLSFILLLGSLYVISGGLYLRGAPTGSPIVNTGFLAIGTLLASFIGTTGASMLLIRPLLRANAHRRDKVHIIVFFIFLVSNLGGCLTPLGDPPLYLGFLNGVPFLWTFRLAPHWALACALLLVLFHFYDEWKFEKEDLATPGELIRDVQPGASERLGLEGKQNLLFLGGVLAAVYCSGQFQWPWGVQEGAMAALTVGSMLATPKALRKKNRFTFHPIIEVAVLFAGIFVAMIPALLILNARGEALGVTEPWHFFWATGILSSFLDNAPTYLAFAATAAGLHGVSASAPGYLAQFLQTAAGPALLTAISVGAVFMGANTYIGNGPNFMVKSIAEESGVKMPSFFGYMLYSVVILFPVFFLTTFVFFRG